ncbi:tRNA pseudouridine(13) synthase TruD [Pseudoxanthomonas dokdonensis]|uniref:tRNA pseudouridine synthase D n=1 Tax=Pseudoxanthomonas dokdonensis TaxID=344882 RepID=A0A0R0CNX9_9GAMM|nr:tRNA pseudouridine(13) synthase TruD [Pseudoxanthomonas dokdonensis]KRG67882.1 pseudouridine synthase [Pseudoxanthomonas dokdonensis]
MSMPLPRAYGDAALSALMRCSPEDFRVEEIHGFAASGEGEHLLLNVQKRGMNTVFAAKRIAKWAGLPEHAVSYAGLKDRHAVTVQRFSVHLPKRVAPDLAGLQSDDLQVLDASWHNRKLPRGALAGNRFVLTLREVQGNRELIEQRLRQIAARGVPNWFGEQRFGRDGDNVDSALQMFAGQRGVRREERSILLSAARSQLFNQVLATRVAADLWDRGMTGEVWSLEGSRSVFGPEPWSDELAERLARFDIHPSGPLWGVGELRSQAACAQLETEALADERSLRLRAGLEEEGLKQERRSLRLPVGDLDWQWPADDVLVLRLALPPGSYATTVLHELGAVSDAGQAGRRSSESH